MATAYSTALSTTAQKTAARSAGIALFRQRTGLCSIPLGSEYWCLCARQGTEAGSEINQLIASGVLEAHQFVGVDLDEDLIIANRIDHPTATFICGEWTDIIETVPFSPAFVYLDTTGTATCETTADLTTRTMQRCGINCVLLVNVMLTNPYNGERYDPQVFLSNIADRCTQAELDAWGWDELDSFEYSSGKTTMFTLALRRVR